MNLESILSILSKGRKANLPFSLIAKNLDLDIGTVAVFERNLLREIQPHAKGSRAIENLAQYLEVDIGTAALVYSTYEFGKKANGISPVFRMLLDNKNGEVSLNVLRKKEAEKSRNVTNATRIFFSRPRKLARSKVQSVFAAYFNRVAEGEKIRFRDLERDTGIPYTTCSDILREVGLETGLKRSPKLSPEQKQAMYSSPFTAPDIADFTGYNVDTIGLYFSGPNDKYFDLFGWWRLNDPQKQLRYRDASAIYRASDQGFPRGKICTLTCKVPSVVNYALNNREIIGKPIVDFLQQFFQAPHHDKPYRTGSIQDCKPIDSEIRRNYADEKVA